MKKVLFLLFGICVMGYQAYAQCNFTAQANGPGTLCADATDFDLFITTASPPIGSTLSYQFYVDGNAIGSVVAINYYKVTDLTEGRVYSCRVTATGCSTQVTSSSYTIHKTALHQPVAPSIQFTDPQYCAGSSIQFTAQSNDAVQNTSYDWKLNGNLLTNHTKILSLPTSLVQTNGYYYPNSTLSVHVTGLSGECFSQFDATGYVDPNDITINSPTVAGILHVSQASLCDNGSVALSITGNNGFINRFVVRSKDNAGAWGTWQNTTSTPLLSTVAGIDRHYQFKAYVQNGHCAELETNLDSTIVNYKSVIGNLTLATSATCGSAAVVTLTLSQFIAPGISWQVSYSDDAGGAFSPWTTFSNSQSLTQTYNVVPFTDTNMGSVLKPRLYQFRIVGFANGACGTTESNVQQTTISPIPVLSGPSAQTIFSGSLTNLAIASSLPTTTYNYNLTFHHVVPAGSPASVSPISQQLTTTSADSLGTVNYEIIPTAYGCTGTSLMILVKVYPFPVITAPANRLNLNGPVVMSAQALYATGFQWLRSDDGSFVDNIHFPLTVTVGGNYFLRVTRDGVVKDSQPFLIYSDFGGQVENYIVSNLIQTPGLTDATTIDSKTSATVIQSVEYYDGLGRPFQGVSTQGSPSHRDVVSAQTYDNAGRAFRSYLPFSSTATADGFRKTGITNAAGDFTGVASGFYSGTPAAVAIDAVPYSQTTYEAAPGSRAIKQSAPGASWKTVNPANNIYDLSDKTVKYRYESNDTTEVLLFNYDPATGLLNSVSGADKYYLPRTLYRKRTFDEHGNEVVEYADMKGRMICKKTQTSTTAGNVKIYASTYYIYDAVGRLVVVLPPQALKALLSQN